MANQIPGIQARVQPGVFARLKTKQRVNSASGGLRTAAIMGEGLTEEIVISPASGGGADGVNPSFNGSDSPDGRHFVLSNADLVPGKTEVYKNGIPLVVLEEPISISAFDSRYDVRVDNTNGRLQLQGASLVDVAGDGGGSQYYDPSSANVGNGFPVITTSSLVDTNAPAETWTLRATSVIYDGSGDPIPGNAVFTLTGSVSGQLKDGYGNPITWRSDGYTVSNGILSFAISEGATAFQVGDRFTIVVNSGVLQAGDELEARYIPNSYLNDPEVFFSAQDCFAKHGEPSVSNNLSLGVQMAFENGASQVVAVQCKPPVPRKTNELLIAPDDPLSLAVEGATGNADIEDTIFPLGLNKAPDGDLPAKLFVVSSDGTEEELLLNKETFYNSGWNSIANAYSGFVTDGAYTNAYTVFQAPEAEQTGTDGYVVVVNATTIYMTSDTIALRSDRSDSGESDIGKEIVFLGPDGLAGATATSVYTITSLTEDGYLTATLDSGVDPTIGGAFYEDAQWILQDPADTSSFLAITDDVASVQLTAGKGLRVLYTDVNDSSFFDTNWNEAYEALELADVQFVVPLPNSTISNIFSRGKVHVETMSNIVNARERVLIIGAIRGLTPDNLTGRTLAAVEDIGVLEGIQGDDPEEVLAGNIEDLANYDVAAAYGDSFRVIFMAPDEIVRNISGTNTSLPGYYQAPALAGFLSGQTQIEEPPTFKTLTGFNILRDKVYRQQKLNELADAGVLISQPVAGGGRMLHGLTTVQSLAPEEEEISIVGIRDYVARVLRNSLRPFVGRINSPTILTEISTGIDKILRGLISQGLLTSVGNISVRRNPLEPRQVDIAVSIAPAGPINWIYVDVEVAL